MFLRRWLKANLGQKALGALTTTDSKALTAAHAIINLYSSVGDRRVLDAFMIAVNEMQPHTRYLAYHAIAEVLNWEDRPRLLTAAGLEPIDSPGRCNYEPI